MVLVPSFFLVGVESKMLRKESANNAIEARLISEMEKGNCDEEAQITKATARANVLDKEADLILGGLLREDQETPEVKALDGLGVQDFGCVQHVEFVSVKLSGSDLEYHAFVPALNQQESNSPLMRCTWLSLKTTGKPFHTSALPLQVDLELAFPRVTSRAAAPFQQSAEK
jgi:hypothetical protein